MSNYVNEMITQIFDDIEEKYDTIENQLEQILDFAQEIELSFDYDKTYQSMIKDEEEIDFDELECLTHDYEGVAKKGVYYTGGLDLDEAFIILIEFLDEDDSFLGDFIEDKNAVIPEDAVMQLNLRETTTKILSTLTPREERVLRMRFGIGMSSDHTLEEVGQQFSVTRERIRQIEAKALRKLKHPIRSKKLKSFMDS